MKRILISAGLILVAASTLLAQEKSVVFRRYEINWNPISYAHIEGTNGWGSQIGFAGRINKFFGIAADFEGHRNNDSITTDLYAYRVGPRVYGHYGKRVTSFGHFLIGGGQIKGSSVIGGVTTSQSVNGFSMAWGGGLDINVKPWFAIRAGQLDYDYFRFQGLTFDGLRTGGGVVFKMGK